MTETSLTITTPTSPPSSQPTLHQWLSFLTCTNTHKQTSAWVHLQRTGWRAWDTHYNTGPFTPRNATLLSVPLTRCCENFPKRALRSGTSYRTKSWDWETGEGLGWQNVSKWDMFTSQLLLVYLKVVKQENEVPQSVNWVSVQGLSLEESVCKRKANGLKCVHGIPNTDHTGFVCPCVPRALLPCFQTQFKHSQVQRLRVTFHTLLKTLTVYLTSVTEWS